MKSLSIRLKMLAIFGCILALLLAVGGFAYLRLGAVEQGAAEISADTAAGGRKVDRAKDALNQEFALTIRQLLARDAAKAELASALQANRNALDQLIASDQTDVERDGQARQRDRLAAAVQVFRDAQRSVLEADRGSDAPALLVDSRLSPALGEALNAASTLSERAYAHRDQAADAVHQDVGEIRFALALSVAVVILVAFAGAAYLVREISAPLARLTALMDLMRQGDFTQRMEIDRGDEFAALAEGFNRMADEVMGLVGQVQRSGIRVSTSMNEIAATSKQQQATATEVAATTTEIGATSREISATSKELVRTMNEVSSVAEHAADLASSGQAGLSHMGETMAQVMEAAASINAKLAVLNEKAGNINQVVTTITKVADQTNLLSLNAAIEAEKAGEYGRGFSVVSSEIRRLADQTAVATFDIEEMVKEIQAAVSAGVMGMDKFSEEVRRGMRDVQEIGGKLSDVIAQVQALVPRFETVNDGMQAQAVGAEQISEALLQLTETTQQTVESLRQSNSAIDELSQVSGNLHGSISRFKLAA